MENLYELALFAGGGGGLLGSRLLGWRTVCYVENEPYAVEIIKARIRNGMLDDAPIWDDARTFDGRPWAGCVDIFTAGFPCQPWSVAGKHQGEHDKRNLWPETIRIIREVGPEWCLLENVPALLSKPYVQQIFGDLAESGYDTRWDCIPAAAVGAPHLRYRLWIVAHSHSRRFKTSIQEERAISIINQKRNVSHAQGRGKGRLPVRRGRSFKTEIDIERNGENVSNTNVDGMEESGDKSDDVEFAKNNWWSIEPGLGRVAHGMAHRVDRLRAIGNGQVPAVVRAAWLLLARDLE